MKKTEIIARLNAIADLANSYDNGYHYEVKISEWVKYGKDRTYFSIIETRDNSKHYVKKDYGFYDNNAEKFVPGKASIDYTFSGEKFEMPAEVEEESDVKADQPVVMSSQRFLDDEIVEEKKDEIIAEGIQEITCPVTKAHLQDLEGNELYILTDKHHTLAAARELNLPIIFEEVENDFTESTDGEEICAEYFMGDSWFYVNHPDSDMIGRDVW
jgi:hypothetical protein